MTNRKKEFGTEYLFKVEIVCDISRQHKTFMSQSLCRSEISL